MNCIPKQGEHIVLVVVVLKPLFIPAQFFQNTPFLSHATDLKKLGHLFTLGYDSHGGNNELCVLFHDVTQSGPQSAIFPVILKSLCLYL